jgi:recombinational DNA repair protein RecR
MYDFYTINENNHHQGTYFVLDGKITDDNFMVEKAGV